MTDIRLTKSKLRQRYIEIRSKVDKAYREKASNAAAAILTRQSFFQRSQHIACYLPFKKEFDSGRLLRLFGAQKKIVIYPCCKKIKVFGLFVM